jgi:ABC transport system ATP-binding/permease protein
MNYLSLESVNKTFGDRTILDSITFGIDQGQKVALVGVNGSGKSTLLKIVSGIEQADAGEVVFRNDIVVRSLLQNPEFKENQTVIDAVFDADDEALKLIHDYQNLLLKIEAGSSDSEGLQPLIDRIDALNAWDRESQIKQILSKLGIVNFNKKVNQLSGGQQKRISIAQVLIQRPDLLILDEPTNHLDIDTIEWLESYLSQQNMSLILVTHDRYFLEKVTNEILELDEGTIHRYKGDYGHFLEKKAERHENEASGVSKAKNLYRKELEWIRRMPKARGTKAKYRVESFEDTKSKAFSGKSTDKLDLQAKASRQGKKVLEIDSISHGFDDVELIKNFSYIFKRKDRVGIVGPNGVGKTTFLKVLTTELQPTSGEIEKGQTTKFGYYKQQELSFNEKQTVLDFAKDIAEVITLGNGSVITVSQFLTKFLLPPAVQYKPIGKLSGGEKRRLQLLEVLIQSPNFLILDEPTNDLDLITLNTLENYLDEFDGCLILVSHDRYFMDKLVEHLFVFEGDGIISDFPGNYTDFRSQLLNTPTKKKAEKKKEVIIKEAQEKKKLSFNEKREFEQLEKDIAELELQKAELEGKLNSGSENHEELANWSKTINSIGDELDEKEMRWLELSELTN